MLNNPKVRALAAGVIDKPARGLLRLGISPDAVTVAGTVVMVVATVGFLARGQWAVGLILAALVAPSDMLDGTMARLSGRAGPWGAYLDSTLDRVADGAIFGSLAYYYASQGDTRAAAVALLALVGALLVSYARARAEGVGATASVGIAERTERMIIVALGVLAAALGWPQVLPWALALVAVLAWITVVQRIWHVRGQLHPSRTAAEETP